jgi:hypothetical protein
MIASLTRKSRIENFFPGPGFLFPLFVLIVFLMSSCSSDQYKIEVEEAANFIMESLKQGNYGQIPEFKDTFEKMDASAVSDLKEAFRSMEEWTVTVGKPQSNRVIATINMIMDENNKTMDLFFTKIDGQWIPEKEISIYQSIGFIPFIGAKTNP